MDVTMENLRESMNLFRDSLRKEKERSHNYKMRVNELEKALAATEAAYRRERDSANEWAAAHNVVARQAEKAELELRREKERADVTARKCAEIAEEYDRCDPVHHIAAAIASKIRTVFIV